MKKIIAFLLSAVLLLGALPVISLAEERVYMPTVYGNYMLFAENAENELHGYAKNGAEISLELTDLTRGVITKSKTYASKSGTFSITFKAPEGGYTEYSLCLYQNGERFAKYDHIVFGKLWLASGQSNMSYPLAQDKTGSVNRKNGVKYSKWIRTLLIPDLNTLNGKNVVPYEPQNDIEGAHWATGESADFEAISAVAYYFAQNLLDTLDMPVGIINASLGGSTINSWLPRSAIEGDSEILAIEKSHNNYYTQKDWSKAEGNQYGSMTANYNFKIHPVKNFTIDGMIWYQGESEAMGKRPYGEYSKYFDCLQKTYSGLFRHSGDTLPVIFTSLMQSQYGDDVNNLNANLEFADIQNAAPESRALISVYDIPLDYFKEVGAIHPMTKEPIGTRMAYCANGLVYGKNDCYTTASVKAAEVKDDGIYVTLRNVGNGLKINGDKALGFTIAGANGVFVPADAEVVSADTVRIFSEDVPSPAAAAYAYCLLNQNANLCAESPDGTLLPVAIFVTDKLQNARYFSFNPWMSCDELRSWRITAPFDEVAVYNNWDSEKAELACDENGGLHITSQTPKFDVAAKYTYGKSSERNVLSDAYSDFSGIETVKFMARNCGESDAKVNLRLEKNGATWYLASDADTKNADVIIPADSEWHEISFNLNRLLLLGNEGGAFYSNNKLAKVSAFKLVFTAPDADICIDDFSFAPEAEDVKTSFSANFENCDSLPEYFCALFSYIFSLIQDIFNK